MKDSGRVWVIAEQRKGRLMDSSLELLHGGVVLAEKLETELDTVLLGYQADNLAKELVMYGADKVYYADSPQLELYQSGMYAEILAGLVRQHNPEIVLIAATTLGRELAPRTAAKLGTGLTADCINLSINESNQLVQTVPGWGGNVLVNCLCPTRRPQMATVRPGVMEKGIRDESRSGEIIKIKTEIEERNVKVRTIEMVQEESKEVPIEKADIIVAGGWGLQSVENFKILENFASVLGGVVGGTRPAVDRGWLHEDRMIGQSGKTVRPKLYIGVGISGAMHHIVGIQGSKVIVAINSDPHAAIFTISDFGIIGDSTEILPILIQDFKKVCLQ